ncbi:GntR family transcriptional regulator (plasmid) [Streptomyces albidoflavus]|uniref:GntR family transcriptional regulator n=1 Tax=Streptomyces albidoflavus TaxID=1886 RepID=A0A8G1ZJV3_9ACTN|nr:GntR family transcriptional regulator [Streptomyces albidoflavus]RZE15335.1 GntR family transcriptional regulator [Streptomyces albidoflavus]WSU19609.1 GntR family transcriptional regulator [Streptomyces albidoflavus]WTC33769.1 GntR family transcriptional regulator [Streptomyces albidoflavus]CAI4198580.1 GntR family transcriptional regulator [Streptomyces albidoflavus]
MSKWQDLYAQLVRQIEGGEHPPGSKLPKVSDLVAKGRGSTTTVQRAYAELEQDGYVTMRRRGGTIVRDRTIVRIPLSRYSASADSGGTKGPWEAATAAQGLDGRMVVCDPAGEEVSAPEDVAAALGIPAGSPVIRRRRQAMIGDEVVQHQVAWYEKSLAVRLGLDSPSKIEGGVLSLMEPLDPTEADERIRAWRPTAAQAAELGIGSGVPVMTVERTTRNGEGVVLELLRITCAADRVELVYDGLPLKKRRRQSRQVRPKS